MSYSIRRIDGLTYDQYRQDVAFLESTEDRNIDAITVFDRLKEKHQLEMRNKMELWQRGEQHVNKYFHGFNDPGYRECFVFKRHQAGTHHRFYGFLTHPRPLTDGGYRVCILVQHAQKNTEETKLSELDFVNTVRVRAGAIEAVKIAFPEKTGESDDSLHVKE
jgi:hypothetical protein